MASNANNVTLRGEKGAPLLHTELDNNFNELREVIEETKQLSIDFDDQSVNVQNIADILDQTKETAEDAYTLAETANNKSDGALVRIDALESSVDDILDIVDAEGLGGGLLERMQANALLF